MSNSAQKLVKSVQLVGLQLESFKLHRALTVQFSPTMTAIVGPNYSGKTAIEEAVFFALVGASAVVGEKSDLTTQGAKACKVVLTVSWGEDEVKITRTPTTAGVTVNGKLMASGLTAVTEFVGTMFGCDPDIIVRLARSPAGETNALMTWGAAELNSLIEEVYDISAIDKLIDKAAAIVSKAEVARAQLPVELEDLETVSLAQMAKLTELNSVQEVLKEANFLYEADTAQEKILRKQISDANAYNLASSEANKEGARLSGILAECENSLDQEKKALSEFGILDAPTNFDAEIKRLNEFKTKWNNDKNNIELANGQINAINTWLKETYEPAKVKYDEGIPVYEALIKEKEILSLTGVSLSSEITKLTWELNKVEAALNSCVCHACNRPFDEAQLVQATKEKNKLIIDRQGKQELYGLYQKAMNELSCKITAKENELPGEVLDLLSSKVDSLQKHKTILEGIGDLLDYGTTDSDLAALFSDKNAFQTQLQLKTSLQARITTLQNRLSGINAEIAKLPSIKPHIDITPLEALLKKISDGITGLQSNLMQVVQLKMKLENEVGELRKKLEVLTAQTAEVKRLEYRASRFREVLNWLRKNKSTFLAGYWDSLMAIASDFALQATSGQVTKLLRSDDGKFKFEQNGVVQNVKGCASFAQRAIFGASLRMALAELLPLGFGFIVLDEPSAGMDNDHAAALAGALKASNRQIVLITHREGDQHSADSVISLGAT